MTMSARERVLANRAKFAASRSKGLKPYKFREGETLFRILPLTDDRSQEWYRRYGKTYLKTFDNKSFFGIIDRSITFDEPSDPVRELLFDAMRQAPDEDTRKHYRDMLASPRTVFNALILNDPAVKPDEPQLIDISQTQMDNIEGQFLVWSEDDENYDLAALDTGHVFKCEKSGKGMDTKYVFNAMPKKAPLGKDILTKNHDLDAWIESQIEGLEQKALQFLAQINSAIGIQINIPAGLLSTQNTGTSGNAQSGTSSQPQNVSKATVTTMIDPEDVEEAVVEEVVPDEPETPVTQTVAATAAAPAGDDMESIDDILKQLGMG